MKSHLPSTYRSCCAGLLMVCTFSAAPAFSQIVVNSPTAVSAPAKPAVAVKYGWVRATVAGQQSTGAFMSLTARAPTTLVRVATPAAGIAEIHEMKMDGDIMRMRQLLAVDLPAGQAIELKPGASHVMLMDLKQPMKPGSTVPLVLTFRDAKGVESQLSVALPVAQVAPSASAKRATSAASAAGSTAADAKHGGHQH